MMSGDQCIKVVKVDPGVCRFKAKIVSFEEDGKIRCRIESDCPCTQELAKQIEPINPFDALTMPYSENPILREAGKVLKHATCPIPIAILKCIEATAGLALPKDVTIEFE